MSPAGLPPPKGARRPGIPVGTVAGIRLRVHWTVLFIAVLMAWGFAEAVIPQLIPEARPVLRWTVAAVASSLLVASLAAHELAHAAVARRRGVAVQGITLWLLGGLGQMNDDWDNPTSELLIAAAGPLMTLALSALFVGLTFGLAWLNAPPLIVVACEWLATLNVLVLAVNLLPAFPLDGGRILRGALWRFGSDRFTATQRAARGGRLFAYAVVLGGLFILFATTSVSGLWLVFIGWLLGSASRSEARVERARRTLEGVRIADVMSAQPVLVPSWITVELLIDQYVLGHDFNTFPTHGIDGAIEGLVTLHAIKRVPRQRRADMRARDIAVPLHLVPRVTPDELLLDVLKRVGPFSGGRALVFDRGQLIGIVSPSDVARLLQAGDGVRVKRTAA